VLSALGRAGTGGFKELAICAAFAGTTERRYLDMLFERAKSLLGFCTGTGWGSGSGLTVWRLYLEYLGSGVDDEAGSLSSDMIAMAGVCTYYE